MKIVYVHQYFRTPEEGGAIRSWHIAMAMKAAGHDVEMITAHNDPEYKLANIEGLTVHYYPVAYRNSMGFTERGKSFLKFVRFAKKKVQRMVDKPDLIYATSTPLTVAYLALWAKKKYKIPYIFEVRDLWPEAPIAMGAIKAPMIKKYFYNLAKKAYSGAQSVIALSPAMFDRVKEIAPTSKVTCIPNMSDIGFFQGKDEMESDVPLTSFPTVFYAGSLGRANDLDHFQDIIEASEKIGMPINVIVTGEGYYADLMDALHEVHSNFHYLGMQSKEAIRHLYGKSDVSIVSFKEVKVLESNSPNKFFDALATGTPVAINIGGWIADLCEEHKCGYQYDRNDPQEFVRQLYRLKAAGDFKAMSENGLTLAKSFEVNKLTGKVLGLINS